MARPARAKAGEIAEDSRNVRSVQTLSGFD
jgi:hypothetical protein